jgi:phenylacetate-CoA ligase
LTREAIARAAWLAHPGRPAAAYSELLASERFPAEDIRELQLAALRRVLAAAAAVPFYKRRFAEGGFDPLAVRSLDDLSELPLLEREELIRLGPAGLSVRPFRGTRQSSSGSTGRPVEVVWPLEMLGWVHATERRARAWLGVSNCQRRLLVRAGRTQRFYRATSCAYNEMLISATHLARADYAGAIVRKIERRPPVAVIGLSNGIYVLASKMLEQGVSVRAQAILSGGNHLPGIYSDVIEAAFGSPVRQHYASVETGLIAHECEKNSLHLAAELTLVEILQEDGAAAPPGEVGEVVVTALRNRRMPLIRYRLGDRAAISAGSCSCGRTLPAIERLVGRANELISRADGTRVAPEAVSRVLTSARASVLEYQIVQRPDRHLDVQVVQRDEPDPNHYRDLIACELDRLLGSPGMTGVERAERIPASPGGKLRHIVSHVEH